MSYLIKHVWKRAVVRKRRIARREVNACHVELERQVRCMKLEPGNRIAGK